jgi:hypothetical protein
MSGFYFLLPTLLVIFLSYFIVRAAAIALMLTGLSEKKARFQALSAFSGTGFTSKEAEYVMNHPMRRKIVSWLMMLGNAGVATVIVTATSSFVISEDKALPTNVLILLGGLLIIYFIATRKGLVRRWENFIENRLMQYSGFEEGATEDLLHLIEGYGLVRAIIKEGSPLIGAIGELKLTTKGLLILGIERGKGWTPIPKATEKIAKGDRVVIYGPYDALKTLLGEK